MRSRPSTKTSRGLTGNEATARASAQSEARKILSRSMRHGGANATATCARAQMRSYRTSPLRREPLRIVEPARHIVRIENDRGGHDRPSERTTAGFVATGDRPDAALERCAL